VSTEMWCQGRLAAFDVETTGADPQAARIVTAAVSVVGGGVDAEHSTWLVDPGIEIPKEASDVHGVTTEQARRDGDPSAQAVDEMITTLALAVRAGVPIVIFNARYDLTVLDREARRNGLVPLTERYPDCPLLVVDPLILDKHCDRYRKGKRTLGAMCEHYGVKLDDAHAAGADAIAAARLAYCLGRGIAAIRAVSLEALHGCQVEWAAEQAASLEAYFRREGKDDVVERAWPLIPIPKEET
jgi:DNA polymerase III subunit epsilon